MSRRDRSGCEYDAYVPDPLVGRPFAVAGDVAADVADAEAAVLRLNAEAVSLADTEGIARLLLRAESAASSFIEGLVVGSRRLLRAEAGGGSGGRDVTAEEVLGNVAAMTWAVDRLTEAGAVTVDDVLDVHRRLLAGTRHEALGGVVRDRQNWIGGSGYTPCDAAFVPPPPALVPGLLDDLCRFMSSDELSPLAQAAVVHAQFEIIHPFADGNGRTGRALIHVVLRRRGIAPRVLPPLSLVLATWADSYVAGLRASQYLGPPESSEAREGLDAWLGFLAGAVLRAVADAHSFEERIAGIQDRWRASLGPVRGDSTAAALLSVLPGSPVLTVGRAAELTGRSAQAANAALARLESAGVVRQVTVGRRNRVFEAPAVIDAFTSLERRLASRAGDTAVAPPARPAPAR